jgi:hypothetical protein
LVTEGIPVWLDSWQIEVGDPLYTKVYSGIEDSSYVIAIITEHAIKSGWVEKELNAALTVEDRSQRKFILPIRADSVDLPLRLADRVYADFSRSYLDGLEKLLTVLRRFTSSTDVLPPEKRIVSLQFSNTIFLKKGRFSRTLDYLPTDYAFRSDQLIVYPCPIYEQMRSALKGRLDSVRSDPYYSAQLEERLEESYREIRRLENALTDGIVEIMESGHRAGIPRAHLIDICYSYAMYVRSELYAHLYECQNPDNPVVKEFNSLWCLGALERASISKLHGVESVSSVDVGYPIWDDGFVAGLTDSTKVHIDGSGTDFQDVHNDGLLTRHSVRTMGASTLYEFVFPQLIYRKYISRDSVVPWDLDNLYYGPS